MIRPGQVRFLDQPSFGRHGVTSTLTPDMPAKEPRPFLCIIVGPQSSQWLALTSRPATGGGHPRFKLERKHGSRRLTAIESYVDDERYVWTVPHKAILALISDPQRCWIDREELDSVLNRVREFARRRIV